MKKYKYVNKTYSNIYYLSFHANMTNLCWGTTFETFSQSVVVDINETLRSWKYERDSC